MLTLSDSVKLHYLFSCLSGEALGMVSHLKITNENFSVALDILTRRYENRRVLIDRFVDIIMSLPNIHSRSNIRTLFLTPLISAQSALSNLDLPMKDCDYIFVSIVVRKLKGELRTLFERRHGSRQSLPTLKNLISFLEEHARCNETEWSNTTYSQYNQPSQKSGFSRRQSPTSQPLQVSRQTQYQQRRPFTPNNSRPEYLPRTTAPPWQINSAHPTQLSQNKNLYCPYCNTKGHKLITCTRYNDQPIQGRWDFIRARERCQRCLGPHYENECKTTGVCKECGSANHHTSLHRHGASSPTQSSAHLLPLNLREQPRQRPTHCPRARSSHATSHTPSPSHTPQVASPHLPWLYKEADRPVSPQEYQTHGSSLHQSRSPRRNQ